MAEPYLGEIRLFGGNFAPRNWTFCNGQLLDIGQYQALYSLLGTTYGGDGRSSFGLPDLRGRIPISYGQSPGFQNYSLGQKTGVEQVTLQIENMPAHTHTISANNAGGAEGDANQGYFGPNFGGLSVVNSYAEPAGSEAELNAATLTPFGEAEPINNMQPYLCINFIIALLGTYPTRN